MRREFNDLIQRHFFLNFRIKGEGGREGWLLYRMKTRKFDDIFRWAFLGKYAGVGEVV